MVWSIHLYAGTPATVVWRGSHLHVCVNGALLSVALDLKLWHCLCHPWLLYGAIVRPGLPLDAHGSCLAGLWPLICKCRLHRVPLALST